MPLLLFISSYCMWRYGQSSNTTLRILNPLCRHCPEKKDLIWCFGTKRSLLFLEEKKFWFSKNKINFLKEYSPARVKVVNENTSQSPKVLIEFIFSRAALPCLAPQYQCWQKIFLGRPICFSFPAIRPFLHTAQIYSTSRKFKDISKNAQINISLKLLQTLPSKLFRREKIVLMKRSHNSTLRVGASQFHMQASCRVMKWWNRFWIFQEKLI